MLWGAQVARVLVQVCDAPAVAVAVAERLPLLHLAELARGTLARVPPAAALAASASMDALLRAPLTLNAAAGDDDGATADALAAPFQACAAIAASLRLQPAPPGAATAPELAVLLVALLCRVTVACGGDGSDVGGGASQDVQHGALSVVGTPALGLALAAALRSRDPEVRPPPPPHARACDAMAIVCGHACGNCNARAQAVRVALRCPALVAAAARSIDARAGVADPDDAGGDACAAFAVAVAGAAGAYEAAGAALAAAACEAHAAEVARGALLAGARRELEVRRRARAEGASVPRTHAARTHAPIRRSSSPGSRRRCGAARRR